MKANSDSVMRKQIKSIENSKILADLTDGHGKQVMFDVKADLLKELKKDGLGRPFVDLFISTHPHDDHCKGFAENFYHGEVDDYDKDKNKDEIIIEELWITPRGLNNNLSSKVVPNLKKPHSMAKSPKTQ